MPDDCLRVFWEGQPGPRGRVGVGFNRAISRYGPTPYTRSATGSDGRRQLDELIYEIADFRAVDLLPIACDWRLLAHRPDFIDSAANGEASTVWCEDAVLACFGIARTGEASGQAWLCYDADLVEENFRFLARIGRSYLNQMPGLMGLSRVWCEILALDGKAFRLAQFLGFSPEERQDSRLIMSRVFIFH